MILRTILNPDAPLQGESLNDISLRTLADTIGFSEPPFTAEEEAQQIPGLEISPGGVMSTQEDDEDRLSSTIAGAAQVV